MFVTFFSMHMAMHTGVQRKNVSRADGRPAQRVGEETFPNRLHTPMQMKYATKGAHTMKFSESLKSNRDFKNVYNNRKSYANKYLVMYVLENGLDQNRLGISVSKKVGNSVIRHRLTRLIRESYRLHEDMFRSGLDIVVVARVSAKDAKYSVIESALLHVSRLHKILTG